MPVSVARKCLGDCADYCHIEPELFDWRSSVQNDLRNRPIVFRSSQIQPLRSSLQWSESLLDSAETNRGLKNLVRGMPSFFACCNSRAAQIQSSILACRVNVTRASGAKPRASPQITTLQSTVRMKEMHTKRSQFWMKVCDDGVACQLRRDCNSDRRPLR